MTPIAVQPENRARLEDRDLCDAPRLVAGGRVHEPRQEPRAQEALVGLERIRDGHRLGIAAQRRGHRAKRTSSAAPRAAPLGPWRRPPASGTGKQVEPRRPGRWRHVHADAVVAREPSHLLDQVDLALDVDAIARHLDLERPSHVVARSAMRHRRRSKTAFGVWSARPRRRAAPPRAQGAWTPTVAAV